MWCSVHGSFPVGLLTKLEALLSNLFNPFTYVSATAAYTVDFTLSNAKRFYSSMGNPFSSERIKFLVLTQMSDQKINLEHVLTKMRHLDFMHALWSVQYCSKQQFVTDEKRILLLPSKKVNFSAEVFHRKTL